MPEGHTAETVPPHHTPEFEINESALELGVRTHAYFVVDYLFGEE